MTVAIFRPSLPTRLTRAVRALFAAGEQGIWFDPSDLTSMFQDSAGTTPVTAVSQPVGLMLDKRKGLVLGPELVTNGTLDTDISGYTISGGTATWVAGESRLNASAAGGEVKQIQAIPTIAGKSYSVHFDGRVSAGSALYSGVGTYAGGIDVSGWGVNAQTPATKTNFGYTFVATGATSYVLVMGYQTGIAEVFVDNISVKLLDGNHATQATAAARPTLQQDANGKYYLAFDGIDDKLIIADSDGLDFGQGSFIAAFALASLGTSEYDVIYGKGNGTSADNLRCFITPTDRQQLFWGSDAQFYSEGQLISKNTPQIIEYGINSAISSVVYAVNGTEATTAITLSGTGSNALSATIGGQPDNTGYPANMNLYGGIIRKGTQPSAAEKASLRRYLASKSGVTL